MLSTAEPAIAFVGAGRRGWVRVALCGLILERPTFCSVCGCNGVDWLRGAADPRQLQHVRPRLALERLPHKGGVPDQGSQALVQQPLRRVHTAAGAAGAAAGSAAGSAATDPPAVGTAMRSPAVPLQHDGGPTRAARSCGAGRVRRHGGSDGRQARAAEGQCDGLAIPWRAQCHGGVQKPRCARGLGALGLTDSPLRAAAIFMFPEG